MRFSKPWLYVKGFILSPLPKLGTTGSNGGLAKQLAGLPTHSSFYTPYKV